MRKVLIAILLPGTSGLLGCGTIIDLSVYGDGPRIYGGTRWDGQAMVERVGVGKTHYEPAVAFFDMPFSVALDTILLPFTLVRTLIVGEGPYRPASESKEK